MAAALVSREGAPNAGPPSPEAAKAAQMAAWTRSWREVYALAAAVCDRHMAAARAAAGGEADYAAVGALVMPARL